VVCEYSALPYLFDFFFFEVYLFDLLSSEFHGILRKVDPAKKRMKRK
jgi:hypothetical protein